MFPSSSSSTCSYINGLPVRLTKSFQPLPQCVHELINILPDNILKNPARDFEQYDFSVERKALADYEDSLRRAEADSNQVDTEASAKESNSTPTSSCLETVKIDNSSTVTCTAGANNHEISTSNSRVACVAPSSVYAPLMLPENYGTATLLSSHRNTFTAPIFPPISSILQPTPYTSAGARFSSISNSNQDGGNSSKISNRTSEFNNQKSSQTRTVLRVEDFENFQSSPFDAVELKSINDLEELKRLSTSTQNVSQTHFQQTPQHQNGFLL